MGNRCCCGEVASSNNKLQSGDPWTPLPQPTSPEGKQGQARADLQVKDGGFSLGAFMVSNPGKISDFFLFEKKVLGEGGFGSVVKAKDKRTGTWTAVKKVRKTKMSKDKRLREEIEIMRLLDHPHIVRLVESFEDKRTIYLAMELCEGGELFERLARGALTERIAATCCRHMILAVNYLHQNLIIHRDLKPENWLLASKEEVGIAPLKLIDFGISARFQAGQQLKTKVGTPGYTAPEVLAGRYNQIVDIWSLGVILFITLSGQMPFPGKNLEQILSKVKAASYSMDGQAWRKVSDDAKNVVRSFLQKLPSARPSAAQALTMPWLQPDVASEMSLDGLDVESLKNFSKMHKLKRAALTVIATQFNGDGMSSLKNMFLSCDSNGDGTISITELQEALKSTKVPIPEDLIELIKHADTDGSGVIDYTEFLAASLDKKVYHQEEVVWNAFKKFDVDGNGTIDKKELAKVLGDDAVKQVLHLDGDVSVTLFDQVDSNGDGVIDFDEFFSMMCAVDTGAGADPSPRPSGERSTFMGVGSASPRANALTGSPRQRRGSKKGVQVAGPGIASPGRAGRNASPKRDVSRIRDGSPRGVPSPRKACSRSAASVDEENPMRIGIAGSPASPLSPAPALWPD